MPKFFLPTEIKLFVGREHEQAAIWELFQQKRPEWIVQIVGEGGIGKSRFLERLKEKLAGERKLVHWQCPEIIEFYNPAARTAIGLLYEIASRFDQEHFAHFKEERERYEDVLSNEPDMSLRLEAYGRAIDAFFQDWKDFIGQGNQAVLLFDACEEMYQNAVWVGQSFLPRIKKINQEILQKVPNQGSEDEKHPAIFIFSGRTQFPITNELKHETLELRLHPLTQSDFIAFFEGEGWYPEKINDQQIEELYIRCGGRPLFMRLSFDWLKNELGTVDDLLGNAQPFSEKLIEWILRFRNRNSDAILVAALAWRRLGVSLLSFLLDISKDEAEKIFHDLKKFSFVKFHPSDIERHYEESLQLHDELRDLVNRYLWPREGPWTRRAFIEKILQWYEKRIEDAEIIQGNKRPQSDEQKALLVEYLYYRLLYDPIDGSELAEKYFKRASHYMDIGLCNLINQEVSRFEDQLPNDRLDQLRFQQALTLFRQEDFDQARTLWESLTRYPDCNKKLKATSHMLLVELEAYTGAYERALEHARTAEKLYQELLQENEAEPEMQGLLHKELGQLYNNWGYVLRTKSDWEGALKYYNKAMKYHKSDKGKARTLNNIGYVYFEKGEPDKALDSIGEALRIRKKLGIPYELGLGYNTLGIVLESLGRLEDAVDAYSKAKRYFEASHSDRGRALVNINLGKIKRKVKDFDSAIEYLNQAVDVFDQKNDIRYLITSYMELGCIYRDRGSDRGDPEGEDMKKAEEFFKRALDKVKALKDKKTEAAIYDNMSILYLKWAKIIKRKNEKKAEQFFKKVDNLVEQAARIAREENLLLLQAKVERTAGDTDFENKKYEEAFEHLLTACEILASQYTDLNALPMHYFLIIRENADRLQQRLRLLQDRKMTEEYAYKILEELNQKKPGWQNLKIVRDKVEAVLQS